MPGSQTLTKAVPGYLTWSPKGFQFPFLIRTFFCFPGLMKSLMLEALTRFYTELSYLQEVIQHNNYDRKVIYLSTKYIYGILFLWNL